MNSTKQTINLLWRFAISSPYIYIFPLIVGLLSFTGKMPKYYVDFSMIQTVSFWIWILPMLMLTFVFNHEFDRNRNKLGQLTYHKQITTYDLEFLLTQPIDRLTVLRSRSLFYWLLISIPMLCWTVSSFFKPALTILLTSESPISTNEMLSYFPGSYIKSQNSIQTFVHNDFGFPLVILTQCVLLVNIAVIYRILMEVCLWLRISCHFVWLLPCVLIPLLLYNDLVLFIYSKAWPIIVFKHALLLGSFFVVGVLFMNWLSRKNFQRQEC